MDKEIDEAGMYAEVAKSLEQAILRYEGMCASAVLEVLGRRLGAPVEAAVLAAGLGVRWEGPVGAVSCVLAGTAMYIAYRARLCGLSQRDILALCAQWRQWAGGPVNTPLAAEKGLEASAVLLAQAFHFLGGHLDVLGEATQVEKPKQYYDSIYRDREAMFKHSPYALEEKLAQAVTKGEEAMAMNALREITAHGEKAVLAKDPVRSVKNSMIGSIAFLARAAIQAGVSANDSFALSDALTQRVEEMNSRAAVLVFEESILLQFIALVRQRLEACYSTPVVKVVHYVENHLDAPICLGEAAAYAGVHPAYLSARFKKETSFSFTAYIAMRKIQESSYFVRHTGYSVAQIAALYGFSSQSYYITIFKKVMGRTPMAYRRQFLAE